MRVAQLIKKWLELIWLLHIRCKTKDVICYQRYNDPSQGLLQSLTFTISIWATHKHNRDTARNTKKDNAEVRSVPSRYTTWSMLSNVVTAQLLKTLKPVISHPPSSRQINLLQGNQVSWFENSFDETLGTCRATILQPHSACTRHSAQGLCERGKKSVPEGSHDRLLSCPALCLLNPTQQTSPHSSTWRQTDPGPETLWYFLEYEKTDKVQIPGKPKKEAGRQNARWINISKRVVLVGLWMNACQFPQDPWGGATCSGNLEQQW